MNCRMPGFLVLHHLPEFAQTHVHWVGDAIQPAHPLLLPSLLLSIFPSIKIFPHESALCIRTSASESVLPMNIHSLFPLGLKGWCISYIDASRSVKSDSVDWWTVTHQAPPSMGFSRQEYWSELPYPSPGIIYKLLLLEISSPAFHWVVITLIGKYCKNLIDSKITA